jgi:nicotinate-nucleotide adenylyltransferase
MRVGAYPGSFDPPTVAHLAVAEAARHQCGLDRLDLVVSTVALGKGVPARPLLEHRVAVLRQLTGTRPWLTVTVTEHRLLADIADGYDVVVMGADKWEQIVDPSWYGGCPSTRDQALARLPDIAVAPRPGGQVPTGVTVLDVDAGHRPVSSTAVRAGRSEWLAPEAAAFDAATGAWSDPERYDRWLGA